MTVLLRVVLLLLAVICVSAEEKREENKGDMDARQESPADAKNKNRLTKILEDLRTLDHHDVKKLHRILMKDRILRKLNKALRKERNEMRNKNVLTQLRASGLKDSGDSSELNMHQLKRFMALAKRPSLENMERAFNKAGIALEEKQSTKESDEKKAVDVQAPKNA